jgi:chromosome segregation ATPase
VGLQRHSSPPNKPLINDLFMPAVRSVSTAPDGLVKLPWSSGERAGGMNYDEEAQDGLRADQDGLRARSEQAIGELAQALIDNPTLHNAISAAFGAREKAIEAQQAAMSALNLSSATDLERLERRLRSFSQRLEEVEEQIDDLTREIGALRREVAKKPAPAKKKTKD